MEQSELWKHHCDQTNAMQLQTQRTPTELSNWAAEKASLPLSATIGKGKPSWVSLPFSAGFRITLVEESNMKLGKQRAPNKTCTLANGLGKRSSLISFFKKITYLQY